MYNPNRPPYGHPATAFRYRRPVAWVTWFILGSTVAVFLAQLLADSIYGDDFIGDALAFNGAALAHHHYWKLITYAWVHAVDLFGQPGLFWLHIVSNMLPLIWLGPMVEEIIGHARFLGLYLGGAIVSALTWYYFNGHSGEGIIGASGAIFALVAAAGTAAPGQRLYVGLFFILPPFPMRMAVLAFAICATEVVQIVFHWMPDVAHSAHLGGAAFGFLYVLIIRLSARRHLSV